MGIEELLLAQARHEGELSKECAFVRTLIKETDFDDRKIASLAAVAIDLVKGTRAELSAA